LFGFRLTLVLLIYVFEQVPNLLSQFRVVSVAMRRNGMGDGGVQDFFFLAFKAQGATAVARVVAAIN
jgi:hypothetical protein